MQVVNISSMQILHVHYDNFFCFRSVPLPKRKLVDKKLAQLVTTQHKKVPFRKRTIALPSNVELAR